MRTTTLISLYLLLRLSISAVAGQVLNPSDFATTVQEYVQGGAVPIDTITGFPGFPFNNPATALGRPTVDTTGDGWDTGSPFSPVPVVVVSPAFRYFEVVSIGEGGHLTLKFDHHVLDDPKNPCGLDFIIFGNSFQHTTGGSWTNGDPNQTWVSATVAKEPGVVSVSQDGNTWFTFPAPAGPFADDFAPTLGRIYDPAHPDTSLGPWNLWWSIPTDPTRPLNPGLTPTSFAGLSVAEVAQLYNDSAGGTAFDIGELGLDRIRYVRIDNPVGSGRSPEIDAVADIGPNPVPPDFDCDMDVDDDDLDFFLSCATGPGIGPAAPGCQQADFDDDNDVDMADFGVIQRCLSGADVPARRECAQ